MRYIPLLITLFSALLTGCAQNLSCDKPQPYQAAVETSKVAAPDGLDPLEEDREMRIPRASPQDPRPPGSPCLDLPPPLRAAGSSSSESG
jgi:hypothetical protein